MLNHCYISPLKSFFKKNKELIKIFLFKNTNPIFKN